MVYCNNSLLYHCWQMNTNQFQLLLADDDDDDDDCLFFKQALAELSTPFQLVIVNDGEQLMNLLTKKAADLSELLPALCLV